jgi:hypothetical protein
MPATKGYGYRSWAGWGQESTFGTAVAADTFLRIVSESMGTDRDVFMSESKKEEHYEEAYYGPKKCGGDIVIEANFEGTELLNHDLLGTYTFIDLTAGNFSHLFQYNPAGDHDFTTGLTVEVHRGLTTAVKQHQFAGCHVTRKVIEYDPRGFVRFTYGFRGQGEDLITAAAPSFPTRLPIHRGNISLGSIVFGAGSVTILSGRVEIDMKRDEDRALLGGSGTGSLAVGEALRLDRPDIIGNFVCELDTSSPGSLELYEYFMDGANTSTTVTITCQTAGNISGGTLPYEYVLGGTFQVVGGPPSVQDAGIIQVPLDLRFAGSVASTVFYEQFRNGVSAKAT